MNITFSYDKNFDNLMVRLKEKYGEKLFEIDGIGDVQLDIDTFSRQFYRLDKKAKVVADVSVDPNANVDDRTAIAYTVESPKAMFRLNAYYILWRKVKQLYGMEEANAAVEANISGALYVHDFHSFAFAYCYAFSVADIMREGLPFITKVKSGPCKHYDTFIQHVIQATVYYSNSIAGAVSLPDLFVCWMWYIKKDIEAGYLHNGGSTSIKKKLEQQFQILVYTLNQPFRGGLQSSFTNFSIFDKPFFESLFEHSNYPDGTPPDFDAIDELQKHFSDWFIKEYEHNIFTFPVMTACLAVDENNDIIDQKFLDWVSEINLTNGIFNVYTGEVTNISACCRLRTNLKNEYMNSFGSGGISIGSVRVCTINLPHLAFMAGGNKNKFKKLLAEHLEITYQILYAQRKVLEKRIKQKVAPLYTLGFMHLKRQYSTVGVVGMYEMLELLGIPMETDEGKAFVKKLLLYFTEMNVKQQQKTGWMYNTEQTPVEGAAPKLAAKDKILFGEENHKWPLYSNQFYALTSDIPLVERIKTQGMFDKLMDGGAILHINVAEKIESKNQMNKLIKFAAKQGVVYFAVNYQMNRCVEGHLTVGEMDICNVCGNEIEDKFTRVVGFYTNIKTWNETRREVEYPERKFYSSVLEKEIKNK